MTDMYAGADRPVTGAVTEVLNSPPPGDDEYPVRRNLGTVDQYAPGSPQQVARLRRGLEDLMRRLREDAGQIDQALSAATETGWQGQYATKFHAVVEQLPMIMRGRLLPTLQATVDRLTAYEQRLREVQDRAAQEIVEGENAETRRLQRKNAKDHEVTANKKKYTPQAGALKNLMRAEQQTVVAAVNELDDLRNQKRQQDLLLAQDLDDASVNTSQITSAVIEASTYKPPTTPGIVPPIVGGGGGTGGGGTSPTPVVDDVDQHGTTPGGAGSGATPTGPIDTTPVPTPTGGTGTTGAAGDTPPVDHEGLSDPKRLDPRFPVGSGTDLSAGDVGHDGGGRGLATAGALGGLALGGAALAARSGGAGDTAEDEGPTEAAGGGHTPSEATAETTTDDRSPESADGGIGLALPVAVVAASAVVGLLVVALGGGLKSSTTQRLSQGLSAGWDQSGRRLLGRRVIEELTEASHDEIDSVRDDGAPTAPAITALPGGLVADVPGSWTVARDEHCAVLTPGPAGTFASNVVVVLDPAMPSDPLAGVHELPASVLLDHAAVEGPVTGGRARFGYAAGIAPLTVHRYTVQTDAGTVVATASVATSRVDEDAAALDRVLASIRPAAC